MSHPVQQALGHDSGAIFSPDRKYRYLLWRKWGSGRLLVWCCLNCSTADEHANDPTVFRGMKRARLWGYSGFLMVNLFAWRSTDPKGLLKVVDPVGPLNDRYILEAAKQAATFVCAWGSASPLVPARARDVLAMLQTAGIELHYLKMSETTGCPWHPLYLPDATQPKRWEL